MTELGLLLIIFCIIFWEKKASELVSNEKPHPQHKHPLEDDNLLI